MHISPEVTTSTVSLDPHPKISGIHDVLRMAHRDLAGVAFLSAVFCCDEKNRVQQIVTYDATRPPPRSIKYVCDHIGSSRFVVYVADNTPRPTWTERHRTAVASLMLTLRPFGVELVDYVVCGCDRALSARHDGLIGTCEHVTLRCS